MPVRSGVLPDQVVDQRYRVLGHLADGGMASVYVALDQRLDREVALKVLRSDLGTDPSFVTRFRREARSAARLSHPNVVAVYDQGEDDGLMFLAMELVNGKTLRQVLQDEGPLSPRAALDLLDPVLRALGAAHSAGLVHRDVKPENVLLRDDGVVKVADFGLARAVTTTTATAQTGVLLGTVAYLSPEQVARGVADARSDVYAAGLLLFEMLTGERAFHGDTPIHVAYQHVHGVVPAPSSRVAGLSPELDALVALATARDPDQRPADGSAFLDQLRRSRAVLSPDELDLRHRADSSAAGPAAATAFLPAPLNAATTRLPAPAGRPSASTAVIQRPDAAVAPPSPPGRRGMRAWAVGALLVLLAAAAVWVFTAGPLGLTNVPRLAGLTQAAAVAALDQDRLGADVQATFSETVKQGTVIRSAPGAGAEIRRGSTVDLVVSKGPERYQVPNLVGRTLADAKDQLAANQLSAAPPTEAFSETVPAGLIISSAPGAGASVKKGTAVALVISKGREPVTVASWVNKPADQAVKALTDQGLTVDATKQEFDDTVAKGAVISQNPAGGVLYKGDKVTLVVSKGPPLVTVPSVTGMQRGEATRVLRAAGFQVRYETFMGGFFGTVRSQSVDAGTQAPKGTTITLVIV
ncbi:MAG TPA: Stk1 family PASTA domain-containing Ser/Thr kinase [Dermatophilaceae bacterium]|nr:Stk1 family PASTA domain-containing Ser/Thr kinase [Dermatophilaceae bacterium]